MLLTPCSCLLWLMTSGLWTIRAQDTNENMSIRTPYEKLAPNIDFAFILFEYLQAVAPNENVFFSPISISMALSMMALGANNRTGSQILEGLGFERSPIPEAEIHQGFQQLYQLLRQSDDSLEASMGNILFSKHNQKLTDLSSQDLKRYYRLENVAIDFKKFRDCNQIYEYLKNKPWREIFDLDLELKDPDSLILVNYNFFTGLWRQPFNPGNTKEEIFFVDDKTMAYVPMMFQSNVFNFLYDPILHCLVVQLDYVGNRTAFLVLQNRDEMGKLIEGLNLDTLHRWSQSFVTSRLDLYVPRLSLSGTYNLGDIMKAMGILNLESKHTDLSGITGSPQRKLSKMFHEAKLEVREYGLEPDVPKNVNSYSHLMPAVVRFDRPFLLMVFDKVSWNILFLGKVTHPV